MDFKTQGTVSIGLRLIYGNYVLAASPNPIKPRTWL